MKAPLCHLLAIPIAMSLVSCAGKPPTVDGTLADATKWCNEVQDREIAKIKKFRKLGYEKSKETNDDILVDTPYRKYIVIRTYCSSLDYDKHKGYAFYKPMVEYVEIPDYGDSELKKLYLGYESFTYKKEA